MKNVQIRVEIIRSALGHFADNWVIKESRRLHKEAGVPQAEAIKQCVGIGGAGGKGWSWDTYSTKGKGLRVNYSSTIIPWSDLIPYVWPPVPRKPVKAKARAESAWSAL